MEDMTIVALLESVVSPSTGRAKPLGTKARNFKKVAQMLVRTITTPIPERVTGFPVPRRTVRTVTVAVGPRLKLMKMSERNTGRKSGINQKKQTRSLPNKYCGNWRTDFRFSTDALD